MCEIKIWVGTVHDLSDTRENDGVYLFDEGDTEQDVLRELWNEWVLGYDENDEEGLHAVIPTWDLLHENCGDFTFEFEERTVKIKD
jgi:hypothetical protein